MQNQRLHPHRDKGHSPISKSLVLQCACSELNLSLSEKDVTEIRKDRKTGPISRSVGRQVT